MAAMYLMARRRRRHDKRAADRPAKLDTEMSGTRQYKAAGLIGWPVSHSRSPKLHGYWLEHYQIPGAYLPMPVQPAQLEAALRGLVALGFAGCNVTIPHKEAAAKLV